MCCLQICRRRTNARPRSGGTQFWVSTSSTVACRAKRPCAAISASVRRWMSSVLSSSTSKTAEALDSIWGSIGTLGPIPEFPGPGPHSVDSLGINIYRLENRCDPVMTFSWSEIRNLSFTDVIVHPLLSNLTRDNPLLSSLTPLTEYVCAGNHGP